MNELRCQAITKAFGGTHALERVSCTFARGAVTALIGPNGAGKTTLLDIISGFVQPDEGSVFLDAISVIGLPPHKVAAIGIGRTFQNLRLPLQMTVVDNVLAAASASSDDLLTRALLGPSRARAKEIRDIAREALAFIGLDDQAERAAGTLSYGQQKLLSIAICIAAGRRTLLLDEPFAGVHPQLIDRIINKVRVLASQGCTAVLVEHDLAAVREVADRTVALAHGTVICDGDTAGVLDSQIVQGAFLAG